MAVADIKNPTPQTAAVKTTDFSGFLKPEMSAALFEMARKSSAVMSLARRIPLGMCNLPAYPSLVHQKMCNEVKGNRTGRSLQVGWACL